METLIRRNYDFHTIHIRILEHEAQKIGSFVTATYKQMMINVKFQLVPDKTPKLYGYRQKGYFSC